MKLLLKTPNPEALKSDIFKKIDDNNLQTWSITNIGGLKYLKHTQQWGEKGVIKLTTEISRGGLLIEVLKFDDVNEDVKDFEGYYYGRFCEMIFVNFSLRFTSIDRLYL